jgi:hypothetical protein
LVSQLARVLAKDRLTAKAIPHYATLLVNLVDRDVLAYDPREFPATLYLKKQIIPGVSKEYKWNRRGECDFWRWEQTGLPASTGVRATRSC